MKKLVCYLVLMVGLVSSTHAASRVRHYDLLVAPSRYSVLQVMFDVAANRPSILVSYQGEATTAEPLLHVWNGTSWSPITLHDLREMSFVQKTPTRAILIGNDELLPASVRESLAWMPEVVFIRDLTNTSLLNEFGRIQSWSKREWNWFSTRYNLSLEDEAAPLRKRSWYDRPASSLKKNEAPSYQPAPVTDAVREPMAPPATLPLREEVMRPSDIPAPEVAAPVAPVEPAASVAPAENTAAVVVVQSATPGASDVAPKSVSEKLKEVVNELDPDAEATSADPAPIK